MDIRTRLLTPYPGRAGFDLAETLRSTLLRYAHDDATSSVDRILQRVQESELRGLFRELPRAPAPPDGANTLDLDTLLTLKFPDLGKLQKSCSFAQVTAEEFALLRHYLDSPVPHRRVVGFCALACLCAQKRQDFAE